MSELEPTRTYSNHTATDELRALLNEHGVEWRRTPHYSSESMDNETVFCGIGIEWMASDHLNGRLGLRALKYEVTPEQAVEATLGSCNCSNSERTETCQIHDCEGSFSAVNRPVWRCDCGAFMTQYTDATTYRKPRFCPNCGRRFEVEE